MHSDGVGEMERRYKLMAQVGSKFGGFNKRSKMPAMPASLCWILYGIGKCGYW